VKKTFVFKREKDLSLDDIKKEHLAFGDSKSLAVKLKHVSGASFSH